ncbi:hypothetical protein [Legionella bononiensis]|uniref:hypothetical protein n=1 Tax=Legionella bononiensis TaxID=2793102 RepID=UPI00193437AB|nr:hypothetical protein [Legionella bononiensis]MBL7478807.1 hypothetical protein [Legionella bononiensis]MBL7562469.1 hypothetical protein [Legionella bononiensis]
MSNSTNQEQFDSLIRELNLCLVQYKTENNILLKLKYNSLKLLIDEVQIVYPKLKKRSSLRTLEEVQQIIIDLLQKTKIIAESDIQSPQLMDNLLDAQNLAKELDRQERRSIPSKVITKSLPFAALSLGFLICGVIVVAVFNLFWLFGVMAALSTLIMFALSQNREDENCSLILGINRPFRFFQETCTANNDNCSALLTKYNNLTKKEQKKRQSTSTTEGSAIEDVLSFYGAGPYSTMPAHGG